MLGDVEGMNIANCLNEDITARTGIIIVIRFKCYYIERWIQ